MILFNYYNKIILKQKFQEQDNVIKIINHILINQEYK